MKRSFLLCFLFLFSTTVLAQKITKFEVQGQLRVEADTITNLSPFKVGEEYQESQVRSFLEKVYNLGLFADIRFYKEESPQGIGLFIVVKEKPSITSIVFEGMEELKKEDIEQAMESKLYTIIDEGKIAVDLKMIEKKYEDKGHFLVDTSYKIESKEKNTVVLTIYVQEREKITVAEVQVIGNKAFDDIDLVDKLALQPLTRLSSISSSSLYKESLLERDRDFLAFFYKDNGFAHVKVSEPIVSMDSDKKFVRITHRLEEGLQYNIGKITVEGDIGPEFYTEEQLLEKMSLKAGKLFRYSQFARDVEGIVDLYGDLGYAYVDVNPIPQFNDEQKTVDITYKISKGLKVYFGEISIIGNIKTRDNVIRREFTVFDSELYSGTKLSETKKNINRLGFFEEVQVLKERDEKEEDVLNLKVKIKEKPTGQLQATLGYTPVSDAQQTWFVQGRYDEKNQSGFGYGVNLTGRVYSQEDYMLEAGFSNPNINDSEWSFATSVMLQRQKTIYAEGIEIPEKRVSLSVTFGRKIFELVRGFITLQRKQINAVEESYAFEGYRIEGVRHNAILGLSRRSLDNYLDPTDGSSIQLSHQFTGGFLGGDYEYMETNFEAMRYIPLDFSDNFRTYFKLRGFFGILLPLNDHVAPINERYRLGGHGNLRGYRPLSVGPMDRRGRSPLGVYTDFSVGGDKEMFYQLEYFVPLIPQAGIKSVFFIDFGQVYNDDEGISFADLKYDAGFGFRWMTPIAPFRFEWAYPYDVKTGKFGNVEFIFSLGM